MTEKYSSQIPLIVRQAFKAFGSDDRCAIVVALYEHDKRLTFSQLESILNLDEKVLTTDLKKLRDGAIIVHYTEYIEGKTDISYYELTDFGMDFLKSAMELISSPDSRT